MWSYHGTIYVRFNVAYGAPAPREGVQPEEGGTLQGWGYIRVLERTNEYWVSQQGGKDTSAEPIYTAKRYSQS